MMRSYVSVCVEFEIDRRRELAKQLKFADKVLGDAKTDRSLLASVKRLISRVAIPRLTRK